MKKFLLICFVLIQHWVHAQVIDSLKQELIASPSNLDVLNQLAWQYTYSYQDSCLLYCDKAIIIGLANRDTTSLAYSYYIRGVALESQRNFQESKSAFKTSLIFSNQANLVERKAYTFNSLGILYDQLGKMDSAFFYYEKCLVELGKFDNNGADASILFNMGSLYESMGNYAQALSKYFESLTIREEYKDQRRIAMCLEGIALIYQKQNKYDLASLYFHRSLETLDGEKHALQLEILYSNITNLFLKTEKLDSVAFYLEKVKTLANELNDEEGMAYAISLESKLEIQNANFNKALTLCKEAFAYYSSIKYPLMEQTLLLREVEILALQKKFGEAKKLALSLNRYKSLNSKQLQRDLHSLLAQVNDSLGNYGEALFHERLFHSYQDSIYNVELAGELADLRTKYESEKNARVVDKMSLEKEVQSKELEKTRTQIWWLVIGLAIVVFTSSIIWKLYKDRTQKAIMLEEKNIMIEDALIERELLLKEIHHRVKNNLQIVSSLLNIQAETDFSAQEVIQTSQDRVQAMAMIHEKLYQSEQLNSLNSKDYIETLVEQYKVSHRDGSIQPTFFTQLNEITLSLDKLIPIGLIINECITNTFKYAFSSEDQGEINISLNHENNQAILSISDNGSGFDLTNKKVSLGMRLIEGLTKQLEGRLQIFSENGTHYNISFPV